MTLNLFHVLASCTLSLSSVLNISSFRDSMATFYEKNATLKGTCILDGTSGVMVMLILIMGYKL